MLSLPPSVRIFVAREPADMRKSFDGLSRLVCDVVEQDPQSGHLFCFFNRRRDRVKLLWWDRSGYWLLYKRLEKGRFAIFDQVEGEPGSFPLSSAWKRYTKVDPPGRRKLTHPEPRRSGKMSVHLSTNSGERMLEVDQVRDCKRLHAQGHSIRRIARELPISRNTVRRYVRAERMPGEYRMATRRSQPVSDQLRPRVRELLEAEHSSKPPVPRKQRLTAARIYRLLIDEGLRASESVVKRLVREIRLDLRDPLEHAYLTLEYAPGEDAQVDFFEGVIDHPETGRQKVHILLVRACYSGKTFAYSAPSQSREALFEGLIRSFDFFGGVFRTLWFDNLTPAVRKVLRGRSRELQRAFVAFQAHYGFKAQFCAPGKGHEKGGVEGSVKYARHEILSPIPTCRDHRELQPLCNDWMERDGKRRIRGRDETIDEAFDVEAPQLIARPASRFEAGQTRVTTVSPRAWIAHATNHYSVPVAWVGHEVTVRIDAERVEIRRGPEEVVEHARAYGRSRAVLDINHYLPLLKR
jgi:transposase